MNVWFRPLQRSAACFFRVSDPGTWVISECGCWRSKVNQKDAIPASQFAPDVEVCQKCARLIGITPRPLAVIEVKPELLSAEELVPLEQMRRREPQPEFPDELEGVDLNEL